MHLPTFRTHNILLFFSLITLSSLNHAHRVPVYSHGWPESGPGEHRNGPTYPDSHGQFWKACFYTQPAVHALANFLKKEIDNGADAIDLMGRSCGAGIALNLLAKLVDYEKDPDYFNGTEIKSKEDAQKVFNAINNGSLHLTVPFLDLKHTRYPQIIEWTVCGAIGLGTAIKSNVTFTFNGNNSTLGEIGARGVILGATALCLSYGLNCVTQTIFGGSIQDGLAIFIERGLTPLSRNFDPDHIKPIEAIKIIEGKLKCPILIHYCKSDEVLSNQKEDVEKVYLSLKNNNASRTHLVVSPVGEGFHNWRESKIHAQKEEEFKKEYGISG